jgi:transcriptional regulator with XRE-family HTH domain
MTINSIEIGKRLTIFRKKINMSQTDFAKLLEIPQSVVSEVEKGKKNISHNSIISLLSSFSKINVDWLFTGRGDMFYIDDDQNYEYNYDENFLIDSDSTQMYKSSKKLSSSTGNSVQVIDNLVQVNTVQSKNNLLVPVAAYGGYLGEWTQEYISQDLVYIRIPGEPHQARTFEVSGDSMEPVICHGDYVVCRRCDQLNNIKIGRIYVIVSALYGISVKYIYHGTGYIVMEPANLTSHQATLLDYADIKEIWEVVLRVTGDIKTTEDEPVRSRIATIEHYLYKQNPKWKGI